MPQFSRKPPDAGPIFLLAAPHSHGALVGAMIGQHPETFGLPELNLFVSDILEGLWSENIDAHQAQTHGLLRTVAHLFAGEQTIAAIAMARRWLTRRMHWPTSWVFQEIQSKAVPFRVVEKSRTNVHDTEALTRIREACPDAFYLHLVRHPLSFGAAVLASPADTRYFARAMMVPGEKQPTMDPQLLWLDIERRIEEFLAPLPRKQQAHLRVEELLADPQGQLRRLARNLGLSTRRTAIDAMLHPELSPFSTMGPVGANLGDERQFLENPSFQPPVPSTTSLEGPVPWLPKRRDFRPEVIERARRHGYV